MPWKGDGLFGGTVVTFLRAFPTCPRAFPAFLMAFKMGNARLGLGAIDALEQNASKGEPSVHH